MSSSGSPPEGSKDTGSSIKDPKHALLLKFEFEGKQHELANLTLDDTVNDLRVVICTMLNIDPPYINLKTLGPTRIIDHSDDELKLSAIFSQTRERIVVERSNSESIPASTSSSVSTPPQVQHPTPQKTFNQTIPLQQQQIQSQPSQTQAPSDESSERHRLLPQQHLQNAQQNQIPVCSSNGYFLRHPVPANNSCLFISVHYCLTNGIVDDRIGESMRKVIAEVVASDPERFDEAFLGKPNPEYCAWILDDRNWGGAIELSILCKYYHTEIVAIDVKNSIANRFGEDSKYSHRMLLLYDGLHYDPLKFQPFDENLPIVTMFPLENTEALELGLQVARELKETHQFTDLNAITMICCVCDAKLDAKTASKHASETGHTNFREIA